MINGQCSFTSLLSQIKFLFLVQLLILLFFCLFNEKTQGQQNKLVPTDNWSYDYIQRLQSRGFLEELNPTRIPYTRQEIQTALIQINDNDLSTTEHEWVEKLRRHFEVVSVSDTTRGAGPFRYGLQLEGGFSASNSDSLMPLRDIDSKGHIYPNGILTGYMEKGNFIAHMGIRHDLFYDRDPIGIDATRRLYIRSEDAYMGFQNDYLKVYAGRFQNHWAPYGRSSVILSNNARSFDQINITFGNEILSFQSMLGELDNMNADGFFTGDDPEVGAKLRYLAAHRFDWRIVPNIRLTFFESVLYSGPSSSVSLKYLNPLHSLFFVLANKPQNNEGNLLIGGALWMQFMDRLTIQTQFMLDDIDVERNNERTTFSWFTSVDVANIVDNIDIGLETEAVAYQTYNPEQPEGRYLYLKRGIATQFNDYVYVSLHSNIYSKDLRITPRLAFLWQGEQEINQPLVKRNPDGSLMDIILTGLPERRIRPSLELLYKPFETFTLSLDAGYTIAENLNHISGTSESGFSGMIEVKWQLLNLIKN